MNERPILTDEEKRVLNRVIKRVRGIFNEDQIHQIFLGLEHGLTIEQVQTYANPEFTTDEMFYHRWKLEGKNLKLQNKME